MTCLAFITLAPQAANANEQRFGEKFGVLFKLAGTWTTATPDMSKQLGEMMKGKPGDYFVRRELSSRAGLSLLARAPACR
jgi:hypothetical protein